MFCLFITDFKNKEKKNKKSLFCFFVKRYFNTFENNLYNKKIVDYEPVEVVINLKGKEFLLSSGDIVGSSLMLPRYIVEKKSKFKSNLEVPFNFSKIAQKRLSKIVKNRIKKQKALFAFFSRIWFDHFFISKIIHFSFPKNKEKRNVFSFFKVNKVGFGFFSEILAPNFVCFLLLKNLGKKYRRKSLYFLIRKLKIKYKRLAPKRRIHRKKKKNK